MLGYEESQTERVMEIMDFFNNCYSTRDLCIALWVFTIFVYEMKEGTRQFTKKGSVMEFYKEEDRERVSCLVGFFFSLWIASLTRVLHLFKKCHIINKRNATSLKKMSSHYSISNTTNGTQ